MLRNAARPGARPAPTSASSYVARGAGLTLAAPKQWASFLVTSTSGAKMRSADLKVTIKGAAKVDHEIKERRDGSLLVRYISHMSGDVTIAVIYGRSTIQDSPFRVRCQPPRADTENSTITLLQEHAFIDDTVKACVRTVDQFGEKCSADGMLGAQVLDAASEQVLFDAHVVETGHGVYEVSFVPDMAGLYALSVGLAGTPIRDSPLRIKVLADETLAKNCRCFGSGMAQATAGEATSFTIQAVDGRGVARKSGGDTFEVAIRGPEGDAPHATIRDNAEGTYTVTWSGKFTGLYAVQVALDGASVGGTPFNCNVLPTALAPAECDVQASSSSLIRAGERAEFRIIARDAFGNVRSQGGDDFAVMVRMVEGPGKTEAQATVSEESKGFYKAAFVVKHTGVYQVMVTADAQPIKGVPFKVTVNSGKPDFTKCKLGGPGLQAVRLGQPCDVLIELYDVYSNRITSALDALSDIQVTVDGPSRTTVNPAGMKEGAACFQYVAMHPGVYTVAATIDGRHITNSPATVTASIAKPCAPNCEVLTNTQDLVLSAGNELQILFVAKDKQGVRKSVGGDVFNVLWRASADKQAPMSVARITDLGTGEYHALLNETTAGAYTVAILYGDSHIAGSPLTVRVHPGPLEPAKTVASGAGLRECVARRPATVQILAKDLYGNAVSEALRVCAGEVEAVLRGPEVVELEAAKSEAGCMTLAYTAMKAGTYDLALTHAGRHLAGSPWKVRAMPGPAVAAMCGVEGLPSSVVAGQPFAFSLQTLDECKNATVTTNSVTCEVDSPADGTVPLTVMEQGRGVYKVSGVLKGAAVALLRLLVNGAQVQRTPELTVVPGAPTSVTWVNPTLLTAGLSVTAGEEGEAELACQDAYGNRITNAAVGVTAELKREGGKASDAPCRTQPMPDGTVRVCFRPEKAGPYALLISLGENSGATLTATVMCLPGSMDITASNITRKETQFLAGRTGHVAVSCCDIFGNPTTSIPVEPVTLVPSGQLRAWWSRTPRSSQLFVHFTSPGAGPATLAITSPEGGSALPGSPLQIKVLPDAPCAARCAVQPRSGKRALSQETATLTAGEQLDVDLKLADIDGNGIAGDEDLSAAAVSVTAMAVTGPAVPLQLVAGSGGSTFKATMDRAGLYSVQVAVGGSMLPDWRLPVCVEPGAASAKHCSIRASPVHAAVAGAAVIGQPLSCILTTCDAHGNVRHSGGASVSPVVIRPDGEETSKAKVKDLTDGRYLLSFTPDQPGEYVVSALVNGEEIPADQELQAIVEVPPLTVDMCELFVPEQARSVPAGSSFYVTVGPPESSESVPKPDVRCLVHLQDPNNAMTLFPAVWDQQQVAFVADVFLASVGGNAIWATIDGARVGGTESREAVNVEPNCIELQASDVSGAGLEHCVAGEQADVHLTPRDALGNANASLSVEDGTLALRLVVEMSDGKHAQAPFAHDVSKPGRLKASYTVSRAGPINLTVQLLEPDGSIIQQRAFPVVCEPGEPSPAHFELLWSQKPFVAGQATDLEVVCKDAYSNLLKQLPGWELWSVFMQQGGSQVGSVDLQPLPNSRYGFKARCPSAGPTQLLFSFGGAALFGGPVQLSVQPAPVDVRSCTAEFVGKSTALTAGSPISVKVALCDALRNAVPVSAQQELKVYLAPGKSESVILDNVSAGWRTFEVNGDVAHVAVDKAGSYIVHVTVNGESLAQWPRTVTVNAGPPDAAHCSVVLPPGARALKCCQPTALTLVTRDKEGNTCTRGGARVEVAARAVGSVQPGRVTDNGDGTYTLGLELDVEGDWELTASVESVAVSGMPVKVHAAYDPLAAAEVELVELDPSAPLVAGQPARIVLQAKGVEKTRRVFTGQEAVSVVATNAIGHATPLPVALEQRGLRAVATLTPFTPGPLQLAITIAGEPVAASPLQLTVGAGKISARHCSMTPVTADIASKLAQDLPKGTLVVVHGGDALANAAALEAGDLELAISPADAVTDLQYHTLPDASIAVAGAVEREAEAVVSVHGTKVNQQPLRLRPALAETARLRVVHAPEATPVAGAPVAVMLQACDASGAVLDMADVRVVAELVLRSEQTHPSPFRTKGSENGHATPRGDVTHRSEESPRISGAFSGGLPSSPSSVRRGASAEHAYGAPSAFTQIAHRAIPVTVDAAGPGMFKLSATLDTAGAYLLRAGVNTLAAPDAAFLQLRLDVKAAALSPEHCRVARDEASCGAWVAGGTAKLHVKLADQFGNPVHDVDASQLDVCVSGPGRVTHATNYGARGKSTVVVKLTARAAGQYEVDVRDRASGKSLGGPATALTLHPADLNPRMSTFQIRGWQVTGGQATSVAGADVSLALAVYDIYGNPGTVREDNIVAHASGPGGVVSARPVRTDRAAAAAGAGDAVKDVHVPIHLTAAGLYRLAVEIRTAGGQVVKLPAFQGHESVLVAPGAADPIKTLVEAWPADGVPLPTGVAHNLTIVPCDSYGNAGATGAGFTVRLKYASGEATPVPVSPAGHARASLVAAITPKIIGSPTLQILCTPAAPHRGGGADAVAPAAAQTYLVASKDVHVVAAATAAAQCYLSAVWPEQGGVVGMPAGMLITACDGQGNARREGGDRFNVDIPGLPKAAVQMVDRGDGTYSLQFVPSHEGTVSVHVMLDGAHVRGSPMALSVHRDVDELARGALTGKLSTAVTGLRRGLAATRRQQNNLRAEAEGLLQYVPVLVQSAASDLAKLLAEQQVLLKEAREAVLREGGERRRLHNLVQELRGNIRVYVRVKPLTPDEAATGMTPVLRCSSDASRIECNAGTSTKAFDFDRVFHERSTQAEVFSEVAGLVTSALDGYNVCVFAYGQTGSGKTHTMEGPPADPGINFRTMQELFRVIDSERRASHKHAITASIVEIYNETVRDLLCEESNFDMELQKTATGFALPGLTKVPVTSAAQITDVMSAGYENRCTAAHDINAHSSRSHALLIVEVASTNLASGIRSVGKLTLCDLAGSERVNKTGASGVTLVEAQNINKSLLELGNVMSALMAQSPHVPYRNSKLTMLLQDSLGGDAKALMFCNLAPQPLHVSETLSSLAFASKVSSVVLRTPMRRVEEAKGGAPDDEDVSPRGTPQPASARPPGLPTPRSRTPSVAQNGGMRF